MVMSGVVAAACISTKHHTRKKAICFDSAQRRGLDPDWGPYLSHGQRNRRWQGRAHHNERAALFHYATKVQIRRLRGELPHGEYIHPHKAIEISSISGRGNQVPEGVAPRVTDKRLCLANHTRLHHLLQLYIATSARSLCFGENQVSANLISWDMEDYFP